jgi:hypothetical protein
MTWIIALLLALILVAMVSSNQMAAAGVWKVIRMALVALSFFVAWGILIGYVVWYHATYSEGEWGQIIGIASALIIPPVLLWINRKAIADLYEKDKKALFKMVAIAVGYAAVIMVLIVVVRDLKAAYEYSGWLILIVPMILTGAILIWRSLTGAKNWKEVWFGSSTPDPWVIVNDERRLAESSELVAWEEIIKNWDELTEDEQEALRDARHERILAREERLDILERKLEAERKIRDKKENWTVSGIFFLCAIFTVIGLIGVAWDFAFAYAMELKFVKGRSWVAVGVVVVAGFFILGILASIWEAFQEKKSKNTVK